MAGKIVVLNEMLPGKQRSDDAARLYLRLLIKLASEVGQERFNEAVEKAIETCEHRRPTIATMRRLCGLVVSEPSPVALAWELVTTVVTKHARYNENGAVVLVPRRKLSGVNELVEEPVPAIPADVARAVAGLGGWSSLVESYPAYWSQRLQQFRDLYYTDPVK